MAKQYYGHRSLDQERTMDEIIGRTDPFHDEQKVKQKRIVMLLGIMIMAIAISIPSLITIWTYRRGLITESGADFFTSAQFRPQDVNTLTISLSDVNLVITGHSGEHIGITTSGGIRMRYEFDAQSQNLRIVNYVRSGFSNRESVMMISAPYNWIAQNVTVRFGGSTNDNNASISETSFNDLLVSTTNGMIEVTDSQVAGELQLNARRGVTLRNTGFDEEQATITSNFGEVIIER